MYQWRQTLLAEMKSMGFTRSLLDACVWVLRDQQGHPKVLALLDVDDIIVSGADADTEPVLYRLRTRFSIGKEERSTSEFCGRRLQQRADGSLTVDMSKYIAEKLHEIPMPSSRKDPKDRVLSEHEFTELRSVIYKLAWLGREVRPESAGASSMLASRLNRAVVSDVQEANAIIRYIKSTADRKLIIHATPALACLF
eukprot:3667673-Amphidinium_carterae.2